MSNSAGLVHDGVPQLRPGPTLLRVEDLVVEYPVGKDRKVHAVSGVSLDVFGHLQQELSG